jgi:O-Antigen ligase
MTTLWRRSVRRPTAALQRVTFGDAAVAGIAVFVGAAVALAPVATVAILAGGLATVVIIASGRRSADIFLGTLALLIVVYAFMGRGGAYIGFGGVYVGELGLYVGLLALLLHLPRARVGRLHVVILLFMALGAVRTIPYIGTYGIDALRDAVVWAYALFAIAVSVLLSPDRLASVTAAYSRLIPVFLAWVPVAAAAVTLFAAQLPRWPGAPVGLVSIKYGDVAVQLAGVAAFLLVGIGSGRRRRIPETVLWILLLADLAIVGAISRGGLLAAVVGGGSALVFVRSSSRFLRAMLIAATFFVAMYLVNPSVQLNYAGRAVSFSQLVDNAVSVVSDTGGSNLQGTRAWRLAWWDKIVGYTVDGPYFLTGKGFGINLADDDGFQVTADHSLREPHNGHLAILARGGVPLLILWAALQVGFGIGLARAARRARRAGNLFLSQVAAWVFAFWLAALINMSFDVYLEGPQGGIPFWGAIGLGLVVMRAAREPAGAAEAGTIGERSGPTIAAGVVAG